MDIHTSGEFENKSQNTPVQTKRVIIGGVVVLVAVLGFLYYKYLPVVEIKSARDQAQTQAEIKELVAKVGKLMILPTNEEPTVLEIDDPEAIIAQQPFFTGAEKGDKLLVYQKNARAIIYSPSRNIIVNVGPVTQEQKEQQSAQVSAPVVQETAAPVPPKSTKK